MAKRKVAARSDRAPRAAPASASKKGLEARSKASRLRQRRRRPAGRPSSQAKKTAAPGRASPAGLSGASAPDERGPSPAVPSSLDLDQRPSAARSGRAELEERYREHHETGPGMTAGDVDADWAVGLQRRRRGPGRRQPDAGPGHRRGRGHGARRGVRGRGGTEGGGQDREPRPPPLGTRPGVLRGLPGADEGRQEAEEVAAQPAGIR